MLLFCRLCAEMEGWGKLGAIPTKDNNPMDLFHSPHSEHPEGPGVGVIGTLAEGWQDAERQARLWADRGLTLREAIHLQAPAPENDEVGYLKFVAEGLGVDADTPMSKVVEIEG